MNHRRRRIADSRMPSRLGVAVAILVAGCTGEPAAGPEPTPVATAVATAGMAPPSRSATSPDDITPPDAATLSVLRESDAGLPIIAIRVADERFEVEVAATDAARSRGMGGRDRFPAGTGMLFVHPDDQYRNYWMKNCLVPMDIAFLDRQGRIVAMHRMPIETPQATGEAPSAYSARLKRYPSRRPARYALEVPFGDLERLKLRLGDVLALPRAPLDELAARERIVPGR